MGLLGKLRPDPKCGVCDRYVAACICTRNPARAVKRTPPRERQAPKGGRK